MYACICACMLNRDYFSIWKQHVTTKPEDCSQIVAHFAMLLPNRHGVHLHEAQIYTTLFGHAHMYIHRREQIETIKKVDLKTIPYEMAIHVIY